MNMLKSSLLSTRLVRSDLDCDSTAENGLWRERPSYSPASVARSFLV